MVKIKKTFAKFDVDKEKEVLSMFGFNILSTRENKTTATVKAEIDNEQSNYRSKISLYKKVSKWNVLPLYPVFILTFAAIILISILLALFIVNKNSDSAIYILVGLGIPSCLLLFATVIYTYFKFKNDLHNINISYTLFEIKAMLESLNQGDKDNG